MCFQQHGRSRTEKVTHFTNYLLVSGVLHLIFQPHLRLNRIIGINPCLNAAKDGGDILESVFNQNRRRTGACFFVGSGAVGSDPLGLIQFPEPRPKFGKRDIDCTCDVASRVCFC